MLIVPPLPLPYPHTSSAMSDVAIHSCAVSRFSPRPFPFYLPFVWFTRPYTQPPYNSSLHISYDAESVPPPICIPTVISGLDGDTSIKSQHRKARQSARYNIHPTQQAGFTPPGYCCGVGRVMKSSWPREMPFCDRWEGVFGSRCGK